MRINQLKVGVVFSYLAQAVSVLTGLIYTPIMLRLLGQSEYGLYQLVYSVVSYLNLLSLGFGAGYVRFYSECKADGRPDRIPRLNGMYLTVFSVIAAICLICSMLMSYKADLIFGDGLTEAELSKARVLLALMAFNIALSFINSVFSNNITVHEKFLFERGINFLHLLLNPFVTLPLLLLGGGSIAVVGVSTAFTVILLALNIIYCFKALKMRFSFKDFDFNLLKRIWSFTFFIFLIVIVDRINMSMGKVLLGRYSGTAAVAIFSVASQIYILYTNFSTAVSQMFIPRINRIVAENNGDGELSVLFARVGRIQFLILALVVSGYTLYGREFIRLWAGDEYSDSYLVGVILLVSGTIPLIQNLGLEIQKAKNLHKTAAVVYLAVAVATVFISIPLIKKYTYLGAAIGFAVSLTCGNVLFMNWHYSKRVGLDIVYFWKQLLGLIPALAISIACGWALRRFVFSGSGIVMLALNICVYCVIYALCFWIFGMNESEKNLIRVPLDMLLHRNQEDDAV